MAKINHGKRNNNPQQDQYGNQMQYQNHNQYQNQYQNQHQNQNQNRNQNQNQNRNQNRSHNQNSNQRNQQGPSCAGCGQTGHTFNRCGRNANGEKPWRCTFKGCLNPVADHMTKDCPMKRAYNTVNNPPKQGQQPYAQSNNVDKSNLYCEHCRKRGHAKIDCRALSRYGADATMTSPLSTSQPYCKYCNSTAHTTEVCTNTANWTAYQPSRLKCSRCTLRGHTSNSCNNPAGKDCAYCLAPGHERMECPQISNWRRQGCKTPTTAVRQTFRRGGDTASRSKFEVKFTDKLHPTQNKRRVLEDWRLEYLQSVGHMTEVDRLNAESRMDHLEQEILEEERHIFEPAPNPLLLRRKSQVLGSTGGTRPTRNKPQIRASSIAAYHGRSPSWVEHVVAEALVKDRSKDENKIFQKIAKSRIAYSAEDYGSKILQYENVILNAGIGITRARMNDVKAELLRGTKIYRDPLTIAALFGRKIPICSTCGEHGAVFDKVFNLVHPMTTATELYSEIDDTSHPGWGLFILFRCTSRCSSNGYHFVKIPKSIIGNIDMTDPQYKPWGDLAWEVR